MAKQDDFLVLENISHEVDNSQVKILISSHCMKAQSFLLDKLRKEIERQKEIWKFIGNSNLKLETEIKFADQEIKSLNIASETIKLANIELNKEHLLSKERKTDIFERTQMGKKKYENLWLISKKRYESIPIIKQLIEAKNKNKIVQANINALMNESKHLTNEIKIKTNDLEATDRMRIIELAEFFVRENTKMLIQITEKKMQIKEVLKEIDILEKEDIKNSSITLYDQSLPTDCKEAFETMKDSSLEDNWSTLSKNSEKDTLMLPKLHLQKDNLDILSIKLDQINKINLQNTSSMKRAISSTYSGSKENPYKIHKAEKIDNENYISSYYDMSLNTMIKDVNLDTKKSYNKNFSEKKLIHILEDIKLDKMETYKIVKKFEVTQFQETKYIASKNIDHHENISVTEDKDKKTKPIQEIKSMEMEVTEEIKLPNVHDEDVVVPPSQFLDVSQSCEEKNDFSLNIPNEIEMQTLIEDHHGNSKGIDTVKSQDKFSNNSIASDESYTIIKDKILKKRNLDLSPQFVFSRSTLTHKQHEETITSKFFENENRPGPSNDLNENDHITDSTHDQLIKCDENKSNLYESEVCTVDDVNNAMSSPKAEIKNMNIPVAGLLFNHGPQGIPDSLNLSLSTTGFEDNEDFPHCIDSSILLSPKGDIPAPSSSTNNEVLSQEVPNFLTGFRKTGLSFFGGSSETKLDSDKDQGSGFNFTFGNEEKKGRGGFFNMFH